jgi:hypothetical protein
MAIQSVRANIAGTWYDLTYNSETRRYEAEATLTGTSFYEEGGVYNVVVEATDDTGQVVTADGNTLNGLNLVLLENTPPEIVELSPQPGYLPTNIPTFTFTVTDDGSGVDLDSISVTIDGVETAVTVTGDNASATVSATPRAEVADGTHEIVFTAKDRDGNTCEIPAVYIVDGTPPLLEITSEVPDMTDAYSVVITGTTSDITTPPVSVSITVNGVIVASPPVNDGAFSADVPLETGWNDVVLSSTDRAGMAQRAIYRIMRLVTDRTEADVKAVRTLADKIARKRATAAELAEWNAGTLKGAYNVGDMNRVTAAMEYLNGIFTVRGYDTGYTPVEITHLDGTVDTVWREEDEHIRFANIEAYRKNVAALRGQFTQLATTPETPESMEKLTWDKANDLETILLGVDDGLRRMEKNVFYSGEVFAGEV